MNIGRENVMKGRVVYVAKGDICCYNVLLLDILGQQHKSFDGKVVGNRVEF